MGPNIVILPLWFVVSFLILAITLGIIMCSYFFLNLVKSSMLRASVLFCSFFLCVIIAIIWSSCQLYEVFHGKHRTGLIFYIEYFSVCFIAYFWMIFCLNYVKITFARNIKNIMLLALPPIIFYTFVLTNDFHNMFIYFVDNQRKYGILFKMHFLEFLIYSLIGNFVIVKYAAKKEFKEKLSLVFLVLSFFLPSALTFLKVFAIVRFDIIGTNYRFEDFDLSSVGLLPTITLLMITVFKFRVMNIYPIAYKSIFEDTHSAIAVFDELRKMHISNKFFRKEFKYFLRNNKIRNLEMFKEYLDKSLSASKDKEEFLNILSGDADKTYTYEVHMKYSKKYYCVSYQPLIFEHEIIGHIMSFCDITSYKTLLLKYNKKVKLLDVLNNELNIANNRINEANIRLEKYSSTLREFAVLEERNRLAQELHDGLGHSMTILVTLIEVSKIQLEANPSTCEMTIKKAILSAQNTLDEISSSLNYANSNNYNVHFVKRLNSLVTKFNETGIKINLSIDPELYLCILNCSDIVFRLCQEAITNSVKHGKSTGIDISIKCSNRFIKVLIRDNGRGCENINLGIGLSGMKERLRKIEGKVLFTSSPGMGFSIIADIPLNSGR